MSQEPRHEPLNPVDFRIGNTIRMLRILRRYSQQDLARKLGVTFQQVQKYEKAATRISSSRLFQVARILGTPIEIFFKGSDTDADQQQAAIRDMVDLYDGLSPQFGYHEFVELNRAYTALSDEIIRKAILGLVGAIASESEAVPPDPRPQLRRSFSPPARQSRSTDAGHEYPETEEAGVV
jgi:transcriptional regulator with XRE-family HTH domain